MFEQFKNRMTRHGSHMGQALKYQSDMIMDATFSRDPAYRVCYLQDKDTIFPEQTLDGYKKAKSVFAGRDNYDVSELKGFQPIECKYLVKSYYSIQGDNVDYYLQFRPNAHGSNPNIRVGSFVFVPDDLGVYNLWLIVARDDKFQFPQFYILKCNLLLKWHISPEERPKFEGINAEMGTRFSWCVQRTQSSYNSGVWTDYATTSVENQLKAWMPTNADTDTITYNERFVICNNSSRRIAWEITKVESTTTWGLTKLTFAQQLEYSPVDNLSWINLSSDNYSDNLTGADYDYYCPRFTFVLYDNNENNKEKTLLLSSSTLEKDDTNVITYSGMKPSLKIGGSYKTFTANINTLGKTYWSIDYISNGTTVCTVNLKYSGNKLICDNTQSIYEIADDTKISYCPNGQKLFGIQFKYNKEKPTELKIKCQSVLSMIGGKLVIKAGDSLYNTFASVEMEVESL